MIIAGSEGETISVVVPQLELEYKKLGESQFTTYVHITREHRDDDDDDDQDSYSSSSSLTDSNDDSFSRPLSSSHSHLSRNLEFVDDYDDEEAEEELEDRFFPLGRFLSECFLFKAMTGDPPSSRFTFSIFLRDSLTTSTGKLSTARDPFVA